MTTTLASDRPAATAGLRINSRSSKVRSCGAELPQHLAALERANRIRSATAQHKRDLKASLDPFALLADLIEQEPEGITHAKLLPMLRALPRMGPARVEAMASRWGVTRVMLVRQIGPFADPNRQRPQLTDRQRELVVEMLRAEGERLMLQRQRDELKVQVALLCPTQGEES
jgi:hypothetical protein